MKLILVFCCLITALHLQAQKVNETISAGNEYYRQGKFDEAEKQYTKVLNEQPANATAKFNLANSNYRRGSQDEAIKKFKEIASKDDDPELKGKAYYNQGAIFSKEKKLESSIEAYKNALKQNPADQEARENLQKALMELKKKEPPKKKEEDDKKKKQDQQQKKQQQQPKMNRNEAEQRLKLLEQKEKEVQQRLQKERAKTGGSQSKDW